MHLLKKLLPLLIVLHFRLDNQDDNSVIPENDLKLCHTITEKYRNDKGLDQFE